MCGILASFDRDVEPYLDTLAHRGPDAKGVVQVGNLSMGHTRLAILDLDHRSDQPFVYRDLVLSYNGELWNYQAVRHSLEALGHKFNTAGDTEVFAAALSQWGMAALPRLHGMFAAAWTTDGESVWLARDRFGEIPLHLSLQAPLAAASERRALLAMGCHPSSIEDVGPGECVNARAEKIVARHRYYKPPIDPARLDLDEAATALRKSITTGCAERAIADVPVCCLMSGGIDSSAVAYGLKQVFPHLVGYTAVYDIKSRDLKLARLVAEQLGMELREVIVPQPTTQDLAGVVNRIEMASKAQVEIGWACLHLARAMQADGFKVTFSGEGSDELWASYGFAYHALKTQDWHVYRRDLFLTQARRNFPRTNKIFMAHGVEARLPFLHVPTVELALSLKQGAVQDGRSRPKAVIQRAFQGLLPDEVTRRPKVAFQDGLGLKADIASWLPDPKAFYAAEYKKQFA